MFYSAYKKCPVFKLSFSHWLQCVLTSVLSAPLKTNIMQKYLLFKWEERCFYVNIVVFQICELTHFLVLYDEIPPRILKTAETKYVLRANHSIK